MSHSVEDNYPLKYIITHVFCPLQLPAQDDYSVRNDHALAEAIARAACLYGDYVDQTNLSQWNSVIRMLENLQVLAQIESLDVSQTVAQFRDMNVGDVLVLPIRAQNAGVVFRKQNDVTIYESFELLPVAHNVIATEGKLICSYPDSSIEIPNSVFNDKDFRSELVNFLIHMGHDNLSPGNSDFRQTHPRYITELLTGILKGVGRPADVPRISKRIGDDSNCLGSESKPSWWRSGLWLLIRVALQITLDRSPLGHNTYKEFILLSMCHILENNACAKLSNDLLHFTSTKISRRLRKLGSSSPEWLSHSVLRICASFRSIIENRWKQVLATQREYSRWNLSELDLTRDTQLSLLNSREYLRDTLANHNVTSPAATFDPQHRSRGTLDDFLSDRSFFKKAYRLEPHVTLYDVERAVEEGLHHWVDRVTDNDDACVKLRILADEYFSNALQTYMNNPELLSVMMLTAIELWVALDRMAIRAIPILADYSPEVPISLLENLLLSKAAQLRRVRHAYEYLSCRHSQSTLGSVFSLEITAKSFAVRFYKKSRHHRLLKARIENEARRCVREKIAELKLLNARCLKPSSPRTIKVYQWPLPANKLQAEAAVFELACPVSFDMWRSVSVHLLDNLRSSDGRAHLTSSRLLHNSNHQLKPHFVEHPRSRIALGVREGIMSEPTARYVSIPAKREHVCTRDTWSFFAVDRKSGIAVASMLDLSEIKKYCTYKLENGPYANLQKYVDSTLHTSNEVMAHQNECPEDLSTHEFMAFGHLRSGGSLQWLNILRVLRGRSLSLRRREVHMLIAQAVSQVGPRGSNDFDWVWHQEIQQPTFCLVLLRELGMLVRDVESNWMDRVTMDTISFLLRRLLASNIDHAISLEAVQLLLTVRNKVFGWAQELSTMLGERPGDEESCGALWETAAVCRGTFDVDPAIVPKVFRSAEDTEVFFLCALMIHDHAPTDFSSLSVYPRLLLDRNRRLSFSLENVVGDLIRAGSCDEGINTIIQKVWPSYKPGSRWTVSPDSCWATSVAVPPLAVDQHPHVVRLNILDGSLSVNGKQIVPYLPNTFMQHPLYKLIFGKEMFTVTQGNFLGADYVTRCLISDHEVSFSLRNNGRDLIIRARSKRTLANDSGIIQLIPREEMRGDLPAVLMNGYVHWLDLSTSIIEVRPLRSVWETSPENWRINCTPGKYCMWKGDEHLVDIRSNSWEVVSRLFRPLAAPQNLIVSALSIGPNQFATSRLSVLLPRHDISFYVDEDGELQSRNIRGMVYDEDQSIGTLFGLVNQLVLRAKVKHADTLTRCVLIPDGEISFRTHGHHVHVEIIPNDWPSAHNHITYRTYRIDSELGCLRGDGSLTSKLYCAYLHALTSGCCEDPLTGRSGTEEALSVLQSASCGLAVKLSSRDVELLRLVASLSPLPTWNSFRSAQAVNRCNLPASSQNHDLYLLCDDIKDRYEMVQRYQVISPGPLFKNFPSKDGHLHKRIARRAAYLYPPAFSEQPFATDADSQYYTGRGPVDVSGEHRAYLAATYVQGRYTTSGMDLDLWKVMKTWNRISGVSKGTALSLQYDRSWLTRHLPSTWLQIYNLLREDNQQKWSQMLFSLPAMAYASSSSSDFVPILVTFALHPQFGSLDPPRYGSYQLTDGYEPSSDTLRSCVIECAYPFKPNLMLMRKHQAGSMNKEQQRQAYEDRRWSDANTTVSELVSAWPLETCPPHLLDPNSYDVLRFAAKTQHHFSSPFRNFRLREHVTCVQRILSSLPSHITTLPGTLLSYPVHPSRNVFPSIPWQLSIHELFARPAPRLKELKSELSHGVGAVNTTHRADTSSLHQLIARVTADAVSPFHHQYLSVLRASVESFEHELLLEHDEMTKLPTTEALTGHYSNCRAFFTEALRHLQQCLGPKNKGEEAIKLAGQWPRITANTLFQCLASNSPITLPNHWKTCVIGLALLAQKVQRARRLILLHLHGLREDFVREIQNNGCDGWDDEAHPDWLLIQLQGNFLIRRVQVEVANEMVSPSSGESTAMQLNMGEGKSSVIVPIVAAILADGEQLVHVVVPKPLTRQTLHLLMDRLTGLANRRIYYLPFSRSIKADDQMVDALHEVMLKCMQERGILVVQPEHILSLKLLSVERQLSEEGGKAGYKLLKLQRWLRTHSRDILDESDEILDARSQLIFTTGSQEHLEGSPARWTTTQQVLCLVSKYASSMQELFPHGAVYKSGTSGSFPYLRILRIEAGERLISWILNDIMNGLLPNINFRHLHFHEGLEDAIQAFISSEDIPPLKAHLVKDRLGKTPIWGDLLLLRGLLATGILLHVFMERRWRIDYGLDLPRSMLAVPYRAKDVPADKAEFGHPDIAIILTCLSYYYAGLTEDQLRLSFEMLFAQHDPSLEYELWLRRVHRTVPEFLQTISGINVNSLNQWIQHLVPLFSSNQATIDFYLSTVVFPREAKEFPSKLPSSAWDLVEKKSCPTTGFSGTNDGRHLFPLHITQRDADHQRGTNAKVLSYLLQPENNHYMCMNHEDGVRWTTRELLENLVTQSPEIRVLLDVGAQVLDLRNYELAKAWLDISPGTSAAVYFSEDDELMVCTRDGSTQLLQSSPFAQQIDRCVIYLDDTHTRGTDIGFPSGSRAAVTLGPKVTKDRLVQGCMRMRKLGYGHSVMFFAPPEVDRPIRAVSGKHENPLNSIETMDILCWAIRETWENVRRWAPHWVQQGTDHASRYSTWIDFCEGRGTSKKLLHSWLQPEAKSLEGLYEPRNSPHCLLPTSHEIRQRCLDLGILSLSSAGLDEEQERELAYEVRRERQVERPLKALPANHSVHPDVIKFVKTGIIPAGTESFGKRSAFFIPAWDTLCSTSVKICEAYIWSQSVLVTADFVNVVQVEGKMDDYVRPVHWIVSAKRASGDILVVLSPYEANCLLPDIRRSKSVRLHLYTARITKSVKPGDDLGLYSIPKLPDGSVFSSAFTDQLNVFAGQLFFNDYKSYIRLCRFLGVYARDLDGIEGIIMEPDGFILPKNRNPTGVVQTEIAHTFTSSPLAALKALMNLRCKGMEYSSTHMGKLLQGRLLSQEDFDQ